MSSGRNRNRKIEGKQYQKENVFNNANMISGDSFASKFSKRWENLSFSYPMIKEENAYEEVESVNNNPEQSPESILKEIDDLVFRVHEICNDVEIN